MPIIRFLDPLLQSVFSPRHSVDDEQSFHETRQNAKAELDTSLVDSILHDMAMIDTKSTALLTHISVIIAALVFSIGEVNYGPVKLAIAVELIAYVLVALLNLRSLNIMGPPHMAGFPDGASYQRAILRETLLRRCVYVLCLRIVVVLTAVLPLIILAEIIYDQIGR